LCTSDIVWIILQGVGVGGGWGWDKQLGKYYCVGTMEPEPRKRLSDIHKQNWPFICNCPQFDSRDFEKPECIRSLPSFSRFIDLEFFCAS